MDDLKIPFFVPQCEHKRVLVNRRALYLLTVGGRPSVSSFATDMRYGDDGIYGHYLQLWHSIGSPRDPEVLRQFYVTLGVQQEYIFMLAKCGKCPTCCASRQADLVTRASMESALYDTPCYFVTLTYRNADLPPDRQLFHKDIQDFLKRLRMRWTRQGVDHNIRYMVAGEYGSKYHRPHYHLLLWNNPYGASEFKRPEHERLRQDIFDAWSHCDPQAFDFGECGDGAASYVTKYLSKQAIYKLQHAFRPGYRMPYITSSNRNGGIGRPLIERDKAYYLRNPYLSTFGYLDSSGQYREVPIGSYIKQVLHPSPCRQIPARIKNAYRDLTNRYDEYVRRGLIRPDIADGILHHVCPPHYPFLRPNSKPISGSKCWLLGLLVLNKESRYCDNLIRDLMDYKVSQQVDPGPYYHYLSCQAALPLASAAQSDAKARDKISDLFNRECLPDPIMPSMANDYVLQIFSRFKPSENLISKH